MISNDIPLNHTIDSIPQILRYLLKPASIFLQILLIHFKFYLTHPNLPIFHSNPSILIYGDWNFVINTFSRL
ncbi:unnamed protein product [Meloidogyne enterolobii]|uniref:Uncharacterized protein n=1 Tax=Meloidogyne enterolobii TaxID=390850 RepID=A0ACB1AL79_MELEN